MIMSAKRSRIPLLLIAGFLAILGTELVLGQGRVVHTLTRGLADTLYTRNVATPVSLAAQGAAISTTNLFASAPVGQYRVCWNQQITQAATTSSSLQTTIGWNNGAAKTSTFWVDAAAGSTGTAADTSNTLNSERGNCIQIWSAAAQNITYAVTYSSTGATPLQFSWRGTVERLQ